MARGIKRGFVALAACCLLWNLAAEPATSLAPDYEVSLITIRPAEQSSNPVVLHKTQLFDEYWRMKYSQHLFFCENKREHKK